MPQSSGASNFHPWAPPSACISIALCRSLNGKRCKKTGTFQYDSTAENVFTYYPRIRKSGCWCGNAIAFKPCIEQCLLSRNSGCARLLFQSFSLHWHFSSTLSLRYCFSDEVDGCLIRLLNEVNVLFSCSLVEDLSGQEELDSIAYPLQSVVESRVCKWGRYHSVVHNSRFRHKVSHFLPRLSQTIFSGTPRYCV